MLLDLGGADNFALTECFCVRLTVLAGVALVINTIDSANRSLITLLCHGKGSAVLRNSHGRDALSSFNTRVGLLGLVLQVVDNNIVAGGINDLIIVKEEDVVSDIGFEA